MYLCFRNYKIIVILLDEIAKYMETVRLLDYAEKPLYQNLQDILLQGLKSVGSKDDGRLELGVSENGGLKAKTGTKVNFVLELSFGLPVIIIATNTGFSRVNQYLSKENNDIVWQLNIYHHYL